MWHMSDKPCVNDYKNTEWIVKTIKMLVDEFVTLPLEADCVLSSYDRSDSSCAYFQLSEYFDPWSIVCGFTQSLCLHSFISSFSWIKDLNSFQPLALYWVSKLENTQSSSESRHFNYVSAFLPHIPSACIKWDAYQSSILSSLHAKHSHSEAADAGPVTGQDRGQNLPRGAQPSGWRVTVYNAGFSPLYALILSIVLQLSQLPIRRVSKDHVTLPHRLFAKHPAFSTSTLFYCVFSKYLNTYYARYLAAHSHSIFHSIAPYALSHLMQNFPA